MTHKKSSKTRNNFSWRT